MKSLETSKQRLTHLLRQPNRAHLFRIQACVTRYREPNRNNVALNRWWDRIPENRKQELKAEISADNIDAAEWLKKNASDLSDPDEGRDSHAELYAEFYHNNTERDPDDRDGVDYAEESQEESKEN